MLRNTADEFGALSKALHWLIAAIILLQLAVAPYMTSLSDEDVWYWRLLELHESLGLFLFLFVLPAKFIWMVYSPAPPPLPTIGRWQRRLARTVHGLLLLLIVVLPIAGFLFVASNGEPITLYGILEIPDIGRFKKSVRKLLSGIHVYGAYACAALVALHALGALKHHFLDKDRTLKRMLACRRKNDAV